LNSQKNSHIRVSYYFWNKCVSIQILAYFFIKYIIGIYSPLQQVGADTVKDISRIFRLHCSPKLNSSGSGLENREYSVGIRCSDHATPCIHRQAAVARSVYFARGPRPRSLFCFCSNWRY
jgi:hypothetical protein